MLREEGEDESVGGEVAAINRVREVYERAVAQVPPTAEKRYWRRYIFLWLDYALFEEIETKVCTSSPMYHNPNSSHRQRQDFTRAREIYKTALRVIPNKQFTFTKVWVQFAYFELRRLDLVGARKILGTAIGMCAKESLFKKYIQMEIDVSFYVYLSRQSRTLFRPTFIYVLGSLLPSPFSLLPSLLISPYHYYILTLADTAPRIRSCSKTLRKVHRIRFHKPSSLDLLRLP
jgi:hypothetical protein